MRHADADAVKLLFGPYLRPRLRIAERVHCLYRDKLVVVHGYTDAPLSWPLCRPAEGRGRPGILVEEELAPPSAASRPSPSVTGGAHRPAWFTAGARPWTLPASPPARPGCSA